MKISKNLLIFLFLNLYIASIVSNEDERKPYIVYMGEVISEDRISITEAHHSLLSEAIGDEILAKNSKIHSYGRSFNGFVARLLPHEANLLLQKEGVVSVFPNKELKLLTTRSWDFIGMPLEVKRNQQIESNIIVAVLDTGIWPESPSFNDKGFGPPPKKWKGTCAKGKNFTGCNNKVIGAQFFNLGNAVEPSEATPVDTDGHGTHTSSTAGGIPVKGASVEGIAEGTARGGVPSARIASYKVCWGGCQDMDVLAAFDAAIADGVDIISVSLGGGLRKFFEDSIAIGSFHAMRKGILTSCAAGNDGPFLATVANVAPWIITVAASTIDRKVETNAKLGNGEMIHGIAINTFSLKKKLYPLTNGELAKNVSTDFPGNVSACDDGMLSQKKVQGRIVFCLGTGGDTTIDELGGIGTIMTSEGYEDVAFATLTPATYIRVEEGLKISKYINSTRSAQAVIYKSTTANMTAPAIGTFSSRGPQIYSPNILKPDIAAPGVNILAAYSKLTSLSKYPEDKRIVNYNIESGTSMACPHVSGAAAYVKSFHTKWSPAAIKSALMTTASPMKIKPAEAELASGAGVMDPTRALHPGLIYDITAEDYISFLCFIGYNSTEIAIVTGSKKYDCSKLPRPKGADALNYPSFHWLLEKRKPEFSLVYYRTVTNVGYGPSVYNVKVEAEKGLSITVSPRTLKFDKSYEKRSFKVTLKGKYPDVDTWLLSGSIVWSDSKHTVKSPVLIYRDRHFD